MIDSEKRQMISMVMEGLKLFCLLSSMALLFHFHGFFKVKHDTLAGRLMNVKEGSVTSRLRFRGTLKK